MQPTIPEDLPNLFSCQPLLFLPRACRPGPSIDVYCNAWSSRNLPHLGKQQQYQKKTMHGQFWHTVVWTWNGVGSTCRGVYRCMSCPKTKYLLPIAPLRLPCNHGLYHPYDESEDDLEKKMKVVIVQFVYWSWDGLAFKLVFKELLPPVIMEYDTNRGDLADLIGAFYV